MREEKMLQIEDIMDYLVRESHPELPPDSLAEVFDKLIWCLNDNGSGLEQVRAKWIEGDDLYRAEVALSMKETYPYKEYSVMVEKLGIVEQKWPRLKELCQSIIESWDKNNIQDL
jgi:hypothetical protein